MNYLAAANHSPFRELRDKSYTPPCSTPPSPLAKHTPSFPLLSNYHETIPYLRPWCFSKHYPNISPVLCSHQNPQIIYSTLSPVRPALLPATVLTAISSCGHTVAETVLCPAIYQPAKNSRGKFYHLYPSL